MNEEYKQEYEEINIWDYIRVFRKRKRLILSFFLIAVIGAGVYSFLIAPKVYQIETVLEIGNIEEQIIENPSNLLGKIKNDAYRILAGDELKISEEEYSKIKIENSEGTNLVKIGIMSSNPELAKKTLEEINALILAEHQEKIEIKKESIAKNIERLKAKIASLDEEKKNLEAEAAKLEESLIYYPSSCAQFFLFEVKDRLGLKKQEIEDLYLKSDTLEISLEDIKPSQILKNPSISENPVKPKPLFNIVIAGALGIFIGVFLALGMEWWEKNKPLQQL